MSGSPHLDARQARTALVGRTNILTTTLVPMSASYSAKNTHLHHADLDAGTGLARDGHAHRQAALGVFRHHLQEKVLEENNPGIPTEHDKYEFTSAR